MFAKISLVLTLMVSLLFVTQAQPLPLPVEMKQGGVCASKHCARGCCANTACCQVVEQQKAGQTPVSAPQDAHVQLGTIGLRVYTLLFLPPAREHPLVILDEIQSAHTLSPRAVSCIRLI